MEKLGLRIIDMRIKNDFGNGIYNSELSVSEKKENRTSNKKGYQSDTLIISEDARKMREKSLNSKSKGIEISMKEDGMYNITFMNPAFIHGVVKNGYIEFDNERVMLTDNQKEELTATANKVSERMTQDTLNALAEHNMKVLEQQAEALSQQSGEDLRMMDILRRIMHGEEVSPADEKKLSEYNPEMYALAKQASILSKRDESNTVRNGNAKEYIREYYSGNNDSPLKHLHEYSIDMETQIIDGVFTDIKIHIK